MDDLRHLLGAYFYELWDEHEYSSWEQAVDDFVRRSPDKAREVPRQIDELLGAQDDETLRQTLTEAGCAYVPEVGDRAWLRAVRDHIAERDLRSVGPEGELEAPHGTYEEPPSIAPAEFAAALEGQDEERIIDGLLSLVLSGHDPEWLTAVALELTSHSSRDVRLVAITSLGHIARVHGSINREVVIPRLQTLAQDATLSGRVDDALNDIEHFAAGWRRRRRAVRRCMQRSLPRLNGL